MSGTNGIDEALQLVAGITRGSISFAEAPMRKTVEYIQTKLAGRDEYTPIISSLLGLADSLRD